MCALVFSHTWVHVVLVCTHVVFPCDTVNADLLNRCTCSKATLLCPAAVLCHSFRRDTKPEPVTSTLTSNLQGSTWGTGLLPCLGGCSFHSTGCQRMSARSIHKNKTRRGEGTGTNVHFEKSHNEHTVASLAALSSTQQLNASLYLALRLCRLSIAPLRQSSATLNNGELPFISGCSLLLCHCDVPICSHISRMRVRSMLWSYFHLV